MINSGVTLLFKKDKRHSRKSKIGDKTKEEDFGYSGS